MQRILRIAVPILFIFVSTQIEAQFSLNQFLSGSKEDVVLYQNKAKSEFLNKNQFRSPLIHRVEFRYRTNDFNISVDDFKLRFNPTNPWEIAANKNYYKMQVDYLATEYLFFLNEALYDRYNVVIQYLKYVDYQIVLNRDIQLKSDQYKVWQAQISDPGFEIADFIDLKEDIFNNTYEANQLNYQKERLATKIREAYNYNYDINDFNDPLITLEQVRDLLKTEYASLIVENSIIYQKDNKENLLSEQQIKVEKAEGRRNIGYFQAEYDRLRGDEFDNHMGFQIGIRIPITNPDKPDLSRRKLNLIDDEANLEEDKHYMKLQQKLLIMDLNYQFSQHDIIVNEINNSSISKLLLIYPDLSPSELLKAHASLNKLTKLEQNIRWDILKSYIEYLYITGSLVEYPLRNLLSRDLAELN